MSDLQQMLQADVLTLGMAADQARRAQPEGHIVTYLRVHVVTPADVAARTPVQEAAAEVRLYDTPGSFDDAVAQVRALRAMTGERRIAAFSMADLQERAWAPVPEVLEALADAGLHDMAELPADLIDDLPASIRALQAAGLKPRRITVRNPLEDRKLDVVRRLQRALDEHPDILRVAPLPRVVPVDKPTTGYDDVRMVALTRLAVGGRSVEVDWALYGPKLAQVALTFGADHLDSVAATSDVALGPRRTAVEDLERNIRAAGFEPREYRSAI